MLSLLGWACQYYSRNLPIPAFPWSACRVHLMSSLLGWACQYYSRNLPIPPFPWSACRVHLMSSLPLALGHAYYSRNLDIPPFLWSACRVHLMSSLLGWPNSIHIIPFVNKAQQLQVSKRVSVA